MEAVIDVDLHNTQTQIRWMTILPKPSSVHKRTDDPRRHDGRWSYYRLSVDAFRLSSIRKRLNLRIRYPGRVESFSLIQASLWNVCKSSDVRSPDPHRRGSIPLSRRLIKAHRHSLYLFSIVTNNQNPAPIPTQIGIVCMTEVGRLKSSCRLRALLKSSPKTAKLRTSACQTSCDRAPRWTRSKSLCSFADVVLHLFLLRTDPSRRRTVFCHTTRNRLVYHFVVILDFSTTIWS